MLEEDIQSALQEIQNKDHPPGVKALVKAIQRTRAALRSQIIHHLSRYLAEATIDPKRLVELVKVLKSAQPAELLSQDEPGVINTTELLSQDELCAILNLKNAMGKTALALSIKSRDISTMQALLDLGADVELEVGVYPIKPLALAVTHKCVPVVRCLLNAGAKVTDHVYSFVATEKAIYHQGLVGILLQQFMQDYETHLLLLEQGRGNDQQVITLLAMSDNIQLRSKCRLEPPLLEALRLGFKKAAKHLIEGMVRCRAWAYLNAMDAQGNTALHLAAKKEWNDTILSLIKADALLNLENKDGQTALYIVARLDNFKIMEPLAEKMLLQRQTQVLHDIEPLFAQKAILQRQAQSFYHIDVLKDLKDRMDEIDKRVLGRIIGERELYISQLKNVMLKFPGPTFRSSLMKFVFNATQSLSLQTVNHTLGRSTIPVVPSLTTRFFSLRASDSHVPARNLEAPIPVSSAHGLLFSASASVPAPSLPTSIATLGQRKHE